MANKIQSSVQFPDNDIITELFYQFSNYFESQKGPSRVFECSLNHLNFGKKNLIVPFVAYYPL